jgi:hypothetical protein
MAHRQPGPHPQVESDPAVLIDARVAALCR